jgi:hypothetical protein
VIEQVLRERAPTRLIGAARTASARAAVFAWRSAAAPARATRVSQLGWTPAGIDLSAGILRYASGRLHVARADAEYLPAGDSSVPPQGAARSSPGPAPWRYDRDLARGHLPSTTLTALARRLPGNASRAQAGRHREIRRLALALRDATRALMDNNAELDAIVSDLAPGLTSRPGIGPVTAAQAIVSFSHPGRCRHDAAFARFADTSPIEASSGQTTRHRLNRGGDRALNKAIHVIATTRMRSDPATRAYITRRRAQGNPTGRSAAASSATSPASSTAP